MTAASLLLLAAEIWIGISAGGWVRNYLGDVLVVILLYTIARSILTNRISNGYALPAGILLFAFLVEFLQLWGFCDRFHITQPLLRILIGTGYSVWDLVSYAIGALPCFLTEFLLFRICRREADT